MEDVRKGACYWLLSSAEVRVVNSIFCLVSLDLAARFGLSFLHTPPDS